MTIKETRLVEQRHSMARQQGVVLVVTLVLLAVMTLLAVTALRTTGLEEKMAGNMQDRNVAFQSGESALRDGEGWISSLTVEPEPDTSASEGVYELGSLPADIATQATSWWNTNGTEYGADTGAAVLPDVAWQPHYVVEFRAFVRDSFDVGFGPPTGRNFYTVTVRGTGAQADAGGEGLAATVLQTRYAKRFN